LSDLQNRTWRREKGVVQKYVKEVNALTVLLTAGRRGEIETKKINYPFNLS
jgi:hypothetical protein